MKDARYNKLSAEGATQPAPKVRQKATKAAEPGKGDRKPDRFCRPFRAEYLTGARYGEAEPRRTSGGKAVSEMACWFTAKGNCVIKVSF